MAPPTTNRSYGPEADRLLYQGIFDEQPYYCNDSVNVYKWNAATSTWVLEGGGSGDMTKAVYDPNADGVIALAQLDTGVSTFKQADHDALPNPHHSNANDPTADQKAALPGTDGVPSGTNKYVTNSDPRNSNARTPTAHGHAQADVTNLVSDLAGKLPTSAFSGLATITVAAIAPGSPAVGDLWVDIS